MIRAFLAVDPDDDLRRAIARAQQALKRELDQQAPGGVRLSWVNPERVHLTLKFIGDLDAALVERLRELLEPVVHTHQPFLIPLTRVGVFPRLQQPRVLWVGAQEPWERGEEGRRLAALAQAIDEGAASFGVPLETKPFSPHVTLARIKEGHHRAGRAIARAGVLERPLPLGDLTVRAVALVKSDPGPAGAVYTKLWELGLGMS